RCRGATRRTHSHAAAIRYRASNAANRPSALFHAPSLHGVVPVRGRRQTWHSPGRTEAERPTVGYVCDGNQLERHRLPEDRAPSGSQAVLLPTAIGRDLRQPTVDWRRNWVALSAARLAVG